ncbi:DUF4304 domain-containing protein [Phenylobacterium sp. LjRoot225]|uniref:DUF4304 domain-containing protein n=1 Tax=Phenylobacterium sp. LjRoot225 TaxID=3342285 RepID=UPI003ECFA22C
MGRSYAKALDDVLRLHGFKRSGDDWVRVRDDIWECVNRQSGGLGVTVNFFTKDLETEKLFLEIFGPEDAIQMPPRSERIGALIDGFDRWWKRDERDGAKALADAVLEYGVPWFDRVRTLEQQAERWYGRRTVLSERGYHGRSLIGLALTLYRMGEIPEACAVLRKPVPKTAIQASVREVKRVLEWLGCEACGAPLSAGLPTQN